MNKDILEGNKLIAEFVGMQWQIINGNLLLSSDNGRSWYGKLFDQDWNLLMPVVEKIEGLKLKYKMTVSIIGNACSIDSENHNRMDLEVVNYRSSERNKIQTVWKSVIQFIELYNSQP